MDDAFDFAEDEHNPGWHRWTLRDDSRYNAFLGPLLVRREGENARVRMMPARRHSNLGNNIHGATTLGFIDVALFAAARMFGMITAGSAVTLDLSTQFLSAGRLDTPLDAEVELLRETGRLLFMRGLIMQADVRVAAFAGTIRKGSNPGA